MRLDQIVGDMVINEEAAPLILAMIVEEVNKSPLDTAIRLQLYDELSSALKERIRNHAPKIRKIEKCIM